MPNRSNRRPFAVEQRNPLLNEESLINKHQVRAKHCTNVLGGGKKKKILKFNNMEHLCAFVPTTGTCKHRTVEVSYIQPDLNLHSSIHSKHSNSCKMGLLLGRRSGNSSKKAPHQPHPHSSST